MKLYLERIKIIFRSDYFKDNVIRIALVVSILFNIALWVYIKTQVKAGPFSIALHYTIYFGIDFLGQAREALTIALVGLIILVVNVILGFKIYNYNKLASYFLGITSILVQIFLFFAAYGLVLVNK